MWVAGIFKDTLYTVKERPLDPRWSQDDLRRLLAWCLKAQGLGWSEERAFQAAEALMMKSKNEGIHWSHNELNADIDFLSGRVTGE